MHRPFVVEAGGLHLLVKFSVWIQTTDPTLNFLCSSKLSVKKQNKKTYKQKICVNKICSSFSGGEVWWPDSKGYWTSDGSVQPVWWLAEDHLFIHGQYPQPPLSSASVFGICLYHLVSVAFLGWSGANTAFNALLARRHSVGFILFCLIFKTFSHLILILIIHLVYWQCK